MNEQTVGIDVSKNTRGVGDAIGDKIKAKAIKNTKTGHAELDQ